MQDRIQGETFIDGEMENTRLREEERLRAREQDRIMGKKILIFMAVMAWLVAVTASYLDGGTGISRLVNMLTHVYDFMILYMNFSKKVICDVVSFIVGLVFMVLFSLSTIAVIMLLSIPFLAIIFAFTDI
jgi:hypothetical protein